MKKIYILLTYTGTIISHIVKIYTKDKYTHVSIALDKELNQLYSFGRLNPYNTFVAGMVQEKINEGTFARFKKTKACIYSLEITDEQYGRICSIIDRMYKEKGKYKFNIIGLFLVSMNKKYQKENTFYCAEFVKYILEESLGQKLLPEIVKPMDFTRLDNIKRGYEGLFKNYK